MATFAIGGIVFLTSAISKQQTGEGKYLSMKVFEDYSAAVNYSQIIIAYEDGKIEEIVLEKGKPSNRQVNLQKINETINKLSLKGYQLLTESGTDYQGTTYTFIKR